ncbi:MAG: SURF1 family cytochrome oxidase biogenesis protein [Pseudomonadota bacterium]
MSKDKPVSKYKLILSTLFMLISLAILLSLGTWQMQRHTWKQNLLQDIRSSVQAGPTTYESWKNSSKGLNVIDAEQFSYVRLKGQFLDEKTVYVYAVRDRRVGVLVFTPIVLPKGDIVMVNRGFLSQDILLNTQSSPLPYSPASMQVQGLIRIPEDNGFLTPKPDLTKKLWYAMNIKEMKRVLEIEALNAHYYVQADHTTQANTYLTGFNPKDFLKRIPNRHFMYAWTWYGLALTLIAVYVIFIQGALIDDRNSKPKI